MNIERVITIQLWLKNLETKVSNYVIKFQNNKKQEITFISSIILVDKKC